MSAGSRTPETPLEMDILPLRLAIARLEAGDPVPDWAQAGPWFSVTRTADEISVVCEMECLPAGAPCVGPWRALKVRGPLDFSLTGVLERIAGPLAGAGISLFSISTWDTDYVLVREPDLHRAVSSLAAAGLVVHGMD